MHDVNVQTASVVCDILITSLDIKAADFGGPDNFWATQLSRIFSHLEESTDWSSEPYFKTEIIQHTQLKKKRR